MKKSIIILLIIYAFLPPKNTDAQNTFDTEKTDVLIKNFCNITNASQWNLIKTIKLNFCTYHPQGLVKIGDFFYLSSVEKIIPPEKFEMPQNGYDRSTGTGTGYLFKFNNTGDLISQITLGDSIIHHPGGIDFDGERIWVPVAEYRPNSSSIIYRIDPNTLESEKLFGFNDHIGALACDKYNNTLIGVSWGSRKFYIWEIGCFREPAKLERENENTIPKYKMKLNGNFYIDYQDCHYAGSCYLICGGLKKYSIEGLGKFAFGGLDLIDLKSYVPIHQIPINLHISPELVLANNPFYFEKIEDQLRFYFIPEDNESQIYIYDVIN